MAGIGFELKKMFNKKGILAVIRVYGYAGIICTGPMILGLLLLVAVSVLAGVSGADLQTKDLINGMITYSLLASLFVTNFFSLLTTRYTADQLYMEKSENVMPSYWGSISVMLITGELLYGIFLFFAGIKFEYCFMCILLFGELIVVWTQINYLTAIKDYKGILKAFFCAVFAALVLGYVLIKTKIDIVISLMLMVCVAYGIMLIWYEKLLLMYFPKGKVSAVSFLKWFDKYPQLPWIGVFMTAGLFGHILIMWSGPLQVKIKGLFYGAPGYDIPAILAFLSILVTTVNFVTSVEVNFYPKYRNYFSIFNDGGSLVDILQAEKEMKATLAQELTYTFSKQLFATVVFIIFGSVIWSYIPLGMTADMLGIYRVLCIGYAFYAIGNSIMLIQLYFSDNIRALVSAAVFMITSCAATYITLGMDIKYYGVGFIIGGMSFTAAALTGLWLYLRKIMEYILCSQPVVAEEKRGLMTRIAEKSEEWYERKYPRDDFEEER